MQMAETGNMLSLRQDIHPTGFAQSHMVVVDG